MNDIRQYASDLLYNVIGGIIAKHPQNRKPSDRVICEALNGISTDIMCDIAFQEHNGEVRIRVGNEQDALRALDIIYIFSHVYPDLLLPPEGTVESDIEQLRMDEQ